LADVKKLLSAMKPPSGPPALEFQKGAGAPALDGKRKETTQITLTKGRYALVCFLTDRDGKGQTPLQKRVCSRK
jgi:hypothetical protein